MEILTVTQKLISLGAHYLVRVMNSEEVIMNAKGKIFTFNPYLELIKGDNSEGEPLLIMKGNFLKTTFTIFNSDNNILAEMQFPFISLFKRFTLLLDGRTYEVKGSLIAWHFECKDNNKQAILSITKDFSLRDKFTIHVNDVIPHEIAVLAAIAVDQRFFQSQ
jgi:uncharacterized protein YxjI